MAEIGIASGAIGIASFGITVCKGLVSYCDSYKGAGDDIKALCDETKILGKTLQTLCDSLQHPRLEPRLKYLVEGLIRDCKGQTQILLFSNERIEELSKKLAKMSIRTRALYPLRESKLRKLRENISRVNETLQPATSSILINLSNKTLDMMERIEAFYTSESSAEIIRWLHPSDPFSSHQNAFAKHQKATGLWFINGLEFAEWKNTPNSIMSLHGIAGCGKTVLCSAIIDELMKSSQYQPSFAIAYFYFDFNDHSTDQKPDSVVRSLIVQISSQNGAIPQTLKSLYLRCQNGTLQPSTADLVGAFHDIVRLFSQTYLILDSADESKEEKKLLDLITAIMGWNLSQMHVLLTSRREMDMWGKLGHCMYTSVPIEDTIVDADVERHVRAELESDQVLKQLDVGHRENIAQALTRSAHGNFRWVACQLEELRNCDTPAELEETLNSLPPTLEDTYERALLAIDEKKMEGMRNVLRWLSFSARPMLLDEIAEVMAVEFVDPLRPHYKPAKCLINPRNFFYRYSNLVSVFSVKIKDTKHQELRLAHLSVREYLLSKKILCSQASYYAIDWLSAHRSIAEICLVYLLQFDEPILSASKTPRAYSLARYAAKFWSYHVQVLPNDPGHPADLSRLCVELLNSRGAQLQNQIRFFDPDIPWIDTPDIARSLPDLPSGLYYASLAGLTGSVRLLLKKEVDVNAVGGRYGNALQAASCNGHGDIVALLLENGADANGRGGDYGYAIQAASSHGHECCVVLLLGGGADVNARGGEHCTALHAAAFNGHDGVATLLIQRGAAVDALDSQGQTPLSRAAAEGHEAAVELLLQHGADVTIRDKDAWTALDHAAPGGFDRIVRLLIEQNDAIVNSRDSFGNTPLHYAVGQCHESTVQLLLEMGADVNLVNSLGRTVLFTAIEEGHEPTARVLLGHGANYSVEDNFGWSPLHIAALYGHVEIGRLLLSRRGFEVNARSNGLTPLHVAVLKKKPRFVKLLLNHGARADVSTEAIGYSGFTPLDLLTVHETNGGEKILRRLRIYKNYFAVTGLRAAAGVGRDSKVRELLERGADVNSKDEGGWTALLWAACRGFTSTVRLLVQNGADVNARNHSGESVMDLIVWAGARDKALKEFLLEHGFEEKRSDGEVAPKERDRRGEWEELDEMRDLLISKGSDLPFRPVVI